MSGDAQTRRRKDKKRRRDDEGTPPPTLINTSELANENLSLHVHKECATGGNWCSRIIFFSLMVTLLGVVVLIIVEHRGETDVEIPVASSPWALLFEGWIDDTSPSHEEESNLKEDAEDDHDDHDDEDDENDEEEEEEEEEDEKDEEESVEGQQTEEAEEDVSRSKRELDEGLGSDEEVDQRDVYQYGQEEQGTLEDEGYSQEETYEDDNDDMHTLEEVENTSGDEEMNQEDVNDGDNDDDDDDFDRSLANDDVNQTNEDGEFLNIPNAKDIDDNSDEPLEEVEGDEQEEIVNDIMNDEEPEEVEEEEEEESTSMAVKFGVGLALIVAAHFVLVRRWTNGNRDIPEKIIAADLSRRNTIVPPENLTKVTKISSENAPNKEQEETYKILRSKYKNIDKTAMEELFAKKIADISILEREPTNLKIAGQEKQNTTLKDNTKYESDDDDGEEFVDDEEDEEEEDDEEDEEDEEEEEEEEIEEVDDRELVAKLDAKYGKLPTPPPDSEEEEEEEEEEDEDYEIEDDEEDAEDKELSGWKHVKAPTLPSQTKTQSRAPEKAMPKSGGAQSHEFAINESSDAVEIREENESFFTIF